MTIADRIEDIWRSYGIDPFSKPQMKSSDFDKGEIRVSGKPFALWYGKYCGPATFYSVPQTPVDALDLACKLHDTYFKHPNSDYALRDSAKMLIETGMIDKRHAISYAQNISSPLFPAASFYWRNFIMTLVLAITLLTCSLGFTIFCLCLK